MFNACLDARKAHTLNGLPILPRVYSEIRKHDLNSSSRAQRRLFWLPLIKLPCLKRRRGREKTLRLQSRSSQAFGITYTRFRAPLPRCYGISDKGMPQTPCCLFFSELTRSQTRWHTPHETRSSGVVGLKVAALNCILSLFPFLCRSDSVRNPPTATPTEIWIISRAYVSFWAEADRP